MTKKLKKKQAPSFFDNIVEFVQDERLRLLLGLILLLSSIYLSISFISFLFSGGVDQSKLDISWSEFMQDPTIRVANMGGKKGAFLAHFFINNGFGLASFGFIFLSVLISLRLFSLRLLPLTKTIIITLAGMIWASVLLAFVFIDSYEDSFLFVGGAHGFYLSNWLTAAIGKIGTALLLLAVLCTILMLSFRNSVEWIKSLLVFEKKTQTETTENEEDFIEEEENFSPADFSVNSLEEDTPISALDDELKMEVQETSSPDVDDIEIKITETREEELVKSLQGPKEDYDPTLDLSNYQTPSIDLLVNHHSGDKKVSKEELEENKNSIIETLRHYKIEIVQIKATIGPTITLYEIVPAPGIRISKIKNLEDDIALSLAALGIRIIAPIPGKGTIGIEVPNKNPEIVSMRNVILSKKFQESKYELPIVMGRTISNESFTFDLAKTPHLLVAGATGQGKSVGLNAIITSLLYKKHPSQLKLVMIDPKMVEFSIYSKIEKHFLAKLPDEEEAIITDVTKVVATLNSLCVEMDARYDLLKQAHARNLVEYNGKFIKRRLNPEKGHKFLPYIVVIIDEFADLIMTAGKEVEMPIARIAQKARAVGIHMIIATQRPSTNIITGVIKANFPARIAFKVASMIDSRTILDSPGANQLIGRGDMLISQGSDMTRVQCAFVDTPEVEDIVDHIEAQQGYPHAHILPEYVDENIADGGGEVDLQKRDALFEEAARLMVSTQQGSTSAIQRRFSIGYNRAGRIIDQLEAAGVVGPFEGSKARQVLIQDEYTLEQLFNGLDSL